MLAAAVLGWALGIGLAPWLAVWLGASLAPPEIIGAPELFWPTHMFAAAAVLALFGGILTLARRFSPANPPTPRARWALAALLVAPGAAWTIEWAPRPAPADVAVLAPRRFVRLEAVVATPPSRTDDGWRARLYVTGARDRPVHGWADGSFPAATRPDVGSRWSLAGHLARPEGPRNPGEPDRAARLARQDVFALVRAEAATPLGPAPGWVVARAVDWVRVRMLDGLAQGLSPDRAALFGSLVLGTGASPVDATLSEHFRVDGLSHLLAASGAQVALLAGLVYAAARRARLLPARAALLTLPVMLAYLALTGAPASMVRATLMGTVAIGALAFERTTAPFVTLWLSAAAMLVWDPGTLQDLGFQFSFLATYALCRLARAGSPGRSALVEHPLLRHPVARQVLVWSGSSLRISLTANLWILPWQLFIFQQGSLLALPANLLTEPLVLALTPWGLGVACVGAVCPLLARLTSPVSNLLLALLEAIVNAFAAVPFVAFNTPAVPAAAVALAYFALWSGRYRPRRLVLALTLCAIATCLPMVHAARLDLAVLSVGQGDGIVIHTPGNHWILVDAGPAFRGQDAGAQIILPYLRREGCRKIDLVVATHAHLDHIGGLPAIAQALPIAYAWDPGQWDPGHPYHEVLAGWLAADVPWKIANAPMAWEADGVKLEVLSHPAPEKPLNDGSIVVKLHYGAFSAVLMGDAEADEESRLLAEHQDLRADVLKVGHHGSRTSSSQALLAAVNPRLAIMSVGRNNRFGHPDAEVVDRLAADHIEAARTDHEGAVIVRTDGASVSFATSRENWNTWRVLGPRAPQHSL